MLLHWQESDESESKFSTNQIKHTKKISFFTVLRGLAILKKFRRVLKISALYTYDRLTSTSDVLVSRAPTQLIKFNYEPSHEGAHVAIFYVIYMMKPSVFSRLYQTRGWGRLEDINELNWFVSEFISISMWWSMKFVIAMTCPSDICPWCVCLMPHFSIRWNAACWQ